MRPCRNCPHLKGCQIKAEKLAALRGHGLTLVNFKCDKRLSELQPGQRIEFDMNDGYEADGAGCGQSVNWLFQAIVMRPSRRQPHKLLVWLTHRDGENDDLLESSKNPICVNPARVRPIEGRVELCSECGQPEGTTPVIRNDKVAGGGVTHYCPKCRGLELVGSEDGYNTWREPPN